MRIIPMIALLVIVLGVSGAAQGQDRYERKGFIANDAGEKCWFQQAILEDTRYFHEKLTSTIGEIVFDDPQCMSGSGAALEANKTWINRRISKWYSHKDAKFDVKNLHRTSMYQTRGQCMQSQTYPLIGVTIDYFIQDGSIVKVRHGPSLQGCED